MLKNKYITNASISMFLEENMIMSNSLGQRMIVIDSSPEWAIAVPDQFQAKQGHYLLVCTLVNKIWELSFWKKMDGLNPIDKDDLPLTSTTTNNDTAVKNTSKTTSSTPASLQNGTGQNASKLPVTLVTPSSSINKGLTRSASLPPNIKNSKTNLTNNNKQQGVARPKPPVSNNTALRPPVSHRNPTVNSQHAASYKAPSVISVNPPEKPPLTGGFVARSNATPNDLQAKSQPLYSKKSNRNPIIPNKNQTYINPMDCNDIDNIPF